MSDTKTDKTAFLNATTSNLKEKEDKIQVDELNTEQLKVLLSYVSKRLKLLSKPTDVDESMSTDEEDNFQLPKKTAKRKNTNQLGPNNKIKMTNRYLPLDEQPDTPNDPPAVEEIDTDDDEDNDNNAAPIVLHEKDKWGQVAKTLANKKLNYTKASNIKDGIKIQPQTITDYRQITKYFEEVDIKFHTYQLKKEKTLKIVVKGIPTQTEISEIEEDLTELGYIAKKITRMHNKDKVPIAMVLIEIDRKYKSLYNIKRLCSLSVIVEALKTKPTHSQCHRCQKFGHVQSGCNAEYRCLKCAKGHSTHLCTKPITLPARCSNCQGEHPANYLFCPENPNNPNLQKTRTPTERNSTELQRPNIPAESQEPPVSTAWSQPSTSNTTNNTQNNPPNTPREDENPTDKKEIHDLVFSLFVQFCATNATEEESLDFLNTTRKLLKKLR